MNIKVLKYLIYRIKQNVKCAKCNKKLSDRDLFVTEANNEQAIIECKCSKCEANFKIDAKVHKFRPQKNLNNPPVNSEEINEMKEFLNKFNGDFKSIFKK